MKKFITRVIVFFLIVFFVDYNYGVVFDYLKSHAKNGDFKKTYDICLNKQYDIIVLGSSRAHHHYNSCILSDSTNMTCFNAGFDGNGVITAFGILQLILDRYKPKLIIYDVEPAFDIEVYPPDNNCTRYLGILKPFCKNNKIKEIFKDISVEDYYKQFSGLVRHNSNSFLVLSSFFSKEQEDSNNGFSSLIGSMDNEKNIQQPEVFPLDNKKIEYFRKLLNTIKDNNIPIVVVYSPKYEFTNQVTVETIQNTCDEFDIPFWNYSVQEDFLKPEFFKEPMHLNEIGANRFTADLTSRIKRQSVF